MKNVTRKIGLRRKSRFLTTFVILIGLWIIFSVDYVPSKDSLNVSIEIPIRITENAMSNTILDHKRQNTKKPPLHCTSCNLVLVVGYFRAGSTMMLDVLSQSTNSFYAFEPINFLSFDTYEKANITFLNGTSRLLDEVRELPAAQSEILFNWFNCKFEDINISDLISSNLLHHSRVTSPYYQCQKSRGIKNCLDRLLRACKPKANRILKVVRLRVSTLNYLLQILPGLKVVYLIRDPRGILHSLRKTGLIPEDKLKSESEKLCRRHMADDIPSAIELKGKYPNTIYTVKYETIVNDPLTVFKQIYNFTKLPYTALAETYIKTHLMGKTARRQGNFRTKSGNAQLIASDWRNTISEGQLDIIDRACEKTYLRLGYLQTDLRTVRDMKVSLQTTPNESELFKVSESLRKSNL